MSVRGARMGEFETNEPGSIWCEIEPDTFCSADAFCLFAGRWWVLEELEVLAFGVLG